MAAVARRSGRAPDVMKSCTCLQQVQVSIFCCVCSFTPVGLRAFGRTLTLGPASTSNAEVGFAANMLPQTVLYKKKEKKSTCHVSEEQQTSIHQKIQRINRNTKGDQGLHLYTLSPL